MIRPVVIVVLLALVAGSGGFMAARFLNPAPERVEVLSAEPLQRKPVSGDLLGQPRPDFTHLDVSGRPVSASDFNGRVMLINFWATWCAPCVEEMPMLAEFQADHGSEQLAVVGIALDDAERARAFAHGLGLDYTILLGEADVVLTGRRYGNDTGMLPFSVLVDAQGQVRWTHLGALERSDLERELAKLQ